MTILGEYRWLWIGLAAAIALPVLMRPEGLLGVAVSPPWSQVGMGILIFTAVASLHFRSHWVQCLHSLQVEKQRAQAAARLLQEVRMDAENGARVIKENLDLVVGGSQRPQEAELYLQGAQAHAAKLEQVLERLEGIRLRLGTQSGN